MTTLKKVENFDARQETLNVRSSSIKNNNCIKMKNVEQWKVTSFNLIVYHTLAGGQSVDASLDDMGIDKKTVKEIVKYVRSVDLPKDLSMVPGGIIEDLIKYIDILKLTNNFHDFESNHFSSSPRSIHVMKMMVALQYSDDFLITPALVKTTVYSDNFNLMEKMVTRSDIAESVINLAIMRCGDLSIDEEPVAKRYWNTVSKKYFELFVKWKSHPYTTKMQHRIATIFPQLNRESPFIKLPLNVKCYLLGINPVGHITGKVEDSIHVMENYLYSQGVAAYIEKYIKPIIEAKLRMFLLFHHLPMDTPIQNDCDIMYESYMDYPPHDVLFHLESEKVFFFSRAEFPLLLEKKINHWTTEPLPDHLLKTISDIIKKSEGLPQCEVLELQLNTYLQQKIIK